MLTPEQRQEIANADKYTGYNGGGVNKPRCECGERLKPGHRVCPACQLLESQNHNCRSKKVGKREKKGQGTNTHKDWSFCVEDLRPTNAVGGSLEILNSMLRKVA